MPSEEPLLIPTDAGPTLLFRGVSFYPETNPIEYARRKARAFSPAPGTLLYVPSVGLGHGLRELLSRLGEGCAILCIEADEEVMRCALSQPLPRDPRLLIVRTAEEAGVREALRGLGVSRFRRVLEAPLSGGYRLTPALYARFKRLLEEEIRRHWQNRLTLIALGSLQVRNLLSNLAVLPAALDFSALSSRMPAVVVGAGPSLDQSVPALRAERGRYLLVAADTALPALMAQGLVPDIVVALEAQIANLQDFLPGWSRSTALACDLTSHPSINRLFPGRTFFFSSRFAELSLFDRLAGAGLLPAVFPALGSVGVAAVRAASIVTRGDLYLTGLDFSIPGLRTHARGTPHHLAMLARHSRLRPLGQDTWRALSSRTLLRVPGKGGTTVPTDRVLMSYRDTLRAEMAGHAPRVSDIGPCGLDLGVRMLSGEEFAERLRASPAYGTPGQGTPALQVDGSRGFHGENLRSFIGEETRILRDAASELRQAALTGVVSADSRALLRAIDHAWVHFPDVPDTAEADAGAPGRSFLARAAAAAGYYAARVERIGSVL